MTEVTSNNVLRDWKRKVGKKAPNKLRCCLTRNVIEIPVTLKGEKYVYDAVKLNEYFQLQAATYGQNKIHHPIRKNEILQKIEVVYADSISDELKDYLENLYNNTKFEGEQECDAVGEMLKQKATWMVTIKETISAWMEQPSDHRFYLHGLSKIWKELTKYFSKILKVLLKYYKKFNNAVEKAQKKVKKWLGVEQPKVEREVNEQWRKAHDQTIKYDSEKNTVESDSESDVSDVSSNESDGEDQNNSNINEISRPISRPQPRRKSSRPISRPQPRRKLSKPISKPISTKLSKPVSNKKYFVPKKKLNLKSIGSSGGFFNIFKIIFGFVAKIVTGLFKFLWWLVKFAVKVLIKIVSAGCMVVGATTAGAGVGIGVAGAIGGTMSVVATGGLVLVAGAVLFGIGWLLW